METLYILAVLNRELDRLKDARDLAEGQRKKYESFAYKFQKDVEDADKKISSLETLIADLEPPTPKKDYYDSIPGEERGTI
jgi:hypothetical protein